MHMFASCHASAFIARMSFMHDVVTNFCSCLMQDKDISQVLSSLAALAPSQDQKHMHGISTNCPFMHACLHAYPQDRVSQIPETQRVLKVQAKKRLDLTCMHE